MARYEIVDGRLVPHDKQGRPTKGQTFPTCCPPDPGDTRKQGAPASPGAPGSDSPECVIENCEGTDNTTSAMPESSPTQAPQPVYTCACGLKYATTEAALACKCGTVIGPNAPRLEVTAEKGAVDNFEVPPAPEESVSISSTLPPPVGVPRLPPPPICALDGCDKPVKAKKMGRKPKYCGSKCRNKAKKKGGKHAP